MNHIEITIGIWITINHLVTYSNHCHEEQDTPIFILVGGLEHGFYDFPIILGMENHPNWLSLHFFQRGRCSLKKNIRPGFAVNVDDQRTDGFKLPGGQMGHGMREKGLVFVAHEMLFFFRQERFL